MAQLTFPIYFRRTMYSCWHWCDPDRKWSHCSTSLSKTMGEESWLNEQEFLEFADMDWLISSPESYLERLYVSREETFDRSYQKKDGKSHRFCLLCMKKLVTIYCKQQQQQKRNTVDTIDHTKPIILLSDGSIHQAETKTIAAAQREAKEILGESSMTATIFVPHTKVARPMPPIKMTRIKCE